MFRALGSFPSTNTITVVLTNTVVFPNTVTTTSHVGRLHAEDQICLADQVRREQWPAWRARLQLPPATASGQESSQLNALRTDSGESTAIYTCNLLRINTFPDRLGTDPTGALIDVVRPTRAAYAAADPAESRIVVIKPFLGLKKGEATGGRSLGLTGFRFPSYPFDALQRRRRHRKRRPGTFWVALSSHFHRERKAPAWGSFSHR